MGSFKKTMISFFSLIGPALGAVIGISDEQGATNVTRRLYGLGPMCIWAAPFGTLPEEEDDYYDYDWWRNSEVDERGVFGDRNTSQAFDQVRCCTEDIDEYFEWTCGEKTWIRCEMLAECPHEVNPIDEEPSNQTLLIIVIILPIICFCGIIACCYFGKNKFRKNRVKSEQPETAIVDIDEDQQQVEPMDQPEKQENELVTKLRSFFSRKGSKEVENESKTILETAVSN